MPHLPIGAVAISAALGVFTTAIAYSAGRHGYADSRVAAYGYWAGQALIFVPISVRLLLTRKGSAEAATVVILAVAQYLCTVFYSPLYFSFSDELSHWQTAEHILQTGKLFTTNYSLPIGPHYPGLEEVAAALVQITGLPLFVAGLIVTGIAHLLFMLTLYVLFRNVGRSQRLAGIAILIYSTNPNIAYFDSLFAYQTLGIAFMGIVLISAWRLIKARSINDRRGWTVIAVVAIAATVVTHHVTSYILAATLTLVMVTSLFAKDRRSAAVSGGLALSAVIMILSWLAFAAPQTVSYLWPAVAGLGKSFRALLVGGMAGAPATATSKSFINEVIGVAASLLLSCLLPVGWWQVRQRSSGQVWVLALSIGSLAWYAILVIRFAASDGAELFGRASTFAYVPTAFIAAVALRWLIDHVPRLYIAPFLGAGMAGVLLMSFSGIINSWPPSWERLPGPHQVAGVERSVGPQEIAVSNWILAALGPGNRFAADTGNSPIVSGYGDQVVDLSDAFLYLSPAYTQSVKREVQQHAIKYAFVDLRLTRQLPASGHYFPNDPKTGEYTHPLPLVDMTKFNRAPGVARIFDSGDIVIYDLHGRY